MQDQRREGHYMSSPADNPILEVEFPAEPRIVHDVRQKFEEFVRPCRLGREDVETIKVALSEACSNAVCHGSPRGNGDRIHVRYEIAGDRLVIEIRDEGPGFQPRQIALPCSEDYKPSGRGLFLMQALMDEVEFQPSPAGTCVRLVKRFPEPFSEHGESVRKEARSEGGGFLTRLAPVGYAERA
jgi:anti-sigma regulatory factor (Ser/Thr protein kinase)